MNLSKIRPTLFLTAALLAPVAMLPAQDEEPITFKQDCESELELTKKRLDIAEREAALNKRKYQELKREMNELGPFLEKARYAQLVAEIAEQTAKIRELPLKHPVEPVILSKDELKALLGRMLDLELTPEAVRGEALTWELMELLPPGSDLRMLYSGLLEEQVGGLFNDREQKLYVVDSFDPKSLFGKVILSHEICHAIQDQYFPIGELPFRTKNNDQNLAMSCVLEGDATVLMIEWAAEHAKATDLLSFNEIFNQSTEQLETVPPALVQSLLFPYLSGSIFVTEGMQSDAKGARDKAFKQPPQSTEQIIHPEKFFRNLDPPVEVTLPEWNGAGEMEEIYRNTAGEWVTRLVLTPPESFPTISMLSTEVLVNEPTATRGAAGWGGDQLLTLASPDDSRWAVVWKTSWDTEKDAKEFQDAFMRRAIQWPRFVDRNAIPTADAAMAVPLSGANGETLNLERRGNYVQIVMTSGPKEKALVDNWLAAGK